MISFLIFALQLLLTLSCVGALPTNPRPAVGPDPPGCNKRYLFDGVTKYVFDLDSSNKTRSYSFHLPSSYNQNRNRRYPVVLGFHGSQNTGLLFELDTKLSEDRFSGDKIMVYPNGLGGSWAGPSYHTQSTVEEDILFVQDLLKDLEQRVCIDTKRVYATGMSNGGGFVGSLACSPIGTSLFAAFAVGSGAFYTDINGPDNGCDPGYTPVPILEIHGGSDRTVQYGGGQGEGGPLPAIPDWFDSWAHRNNCTSSVEETTHGGDVHHISWTCGETAGLLQHYKIDSMGHCWADTKPNFSQLSVPQGPSPVQASSIMMQFFDRFQ